MITVIGSINLDLIATVERLPCPGETVPGDDFKTAPGGKGANQALAAARAGARVRMVGAVGRDAFAAQATALLAEGGVDLSAVRESDEPTGVALILVGCRRREHDRGGAGRQRDGRPRRGRRAGIARGRTCRAAARGAARHGRGGTRSRRAAAGAVSLLNTAPFRREAAPLLAKADYVDRQRDRVRPLCLGAGAWQAPTGWPACAPSPSSTGRTIVVTLGGEGVVAVTPNAMLEVAALEDHAGRYGRRRRHVLRLSRGRPRCRPAARAGASAAQPPPARSPA